MLVLEYVEGAGKETHWRDWLAPPTETTPLPLRLRVMQLGSGDYFLLVAVTGALIGFLVVA
jgi:hypothetical protein